MSAFAFHYKTLFFLTWIILYLIFPSWALPISVNARAFVFFGLLIYFFISAYFMNRWFNALPIDKPLIMKTTDWANLVQSNLWLVVICFLSVILHIHPIFLPILIIGDEALHLQSGLWIYDYIDSKWHSLFQAAFWVLIGLGFLFRQNKTAHSVIKKLKDGLGAVTKDRSLIYFIVFLVIGFAVAYFLLLRDISYLPSLVRYPPVSKFLYHIMYSAFGITHTGPRVLQLIFYLLCSIYLYRTVNLFYEKETGLLAASIYLFLPVAFTYAYLGELASGTIFFIVAISFHFIRFIKDGEIRDLLIATYLIGFGFLYKRPVSLMFIICTAFVIVHGIKKRNVPSLIHLRVLSLSLVPIVPWMIISKFYSWRNYSFQMSNLTSLDGKIVNYLVLMSSNLSVVIFGLYIVSIFYICFFKRNTLTIFFGLLFVVYYFFIVSDIATLSPRFSMAFYPTTAVFLSLFVSRISKSIKWRHAFKLAFIVLITYLIIISSVSPSKNRFLTILNKKLHYFPSDRAMTWVKNNVKDGEKILAIRMLSSSFYSRKYAINKDNMVDLLYDINDVSTPEKLIAFYKNNNISYLMFPYSPSYIKNDVRVTIFEYLKNNPNNEFLELAKYNIGENTIYIYKLNIQSKNKKNHSLSMVL